MTLIQYRHALSQFAGGFDVDHTAFDLVRFCAGRDGERRDRVQRDSFLGFVSAVAAHSELQHFGDKLSGDGVSQKPAQCVHIVKAEYRTAADFQRDQRLVDGKTADTAGCLGIGPDIEFCGRRDIPHGPRAASQCDHAVQVFGQLRVEIRGNKQIGQGSQSQQSHFSGKLPGDIHDQLGRLTAVVEIGDLHFRLSQSVSPVETSAAFGDVRQGVIDRCGPVTLSDPRMPDRVHQFDQILQIPCGLDTGHYPGGCGHRQQFHGRIRHGGENRQRIPDSRVGIDDQFLRHRIIPSGLRGSAKSVSNRVMAMKKLTVEVGRPPRFAVRPRQIGLIPGSAAIGPGPFLEQRGIAVNLRRICAACCHRRLLAGPGSSFRSGIYLRADAGKSAGDRPASSFHGHAGRPAVPRRDDIKKILIIGSGPIVIGQACEFDYSGTQACKALREEGYRVILVNSNPATIMTDPDTADRTYIEPITWQYVEKIIERERPDALLPTLGGQTGLNTAMDLARHGVLEKYDCEMIGAREDVINRAEERESFKEAMTAIGLDVPRSASVRTMEEARVAVEEIGLPIIVRASFTLGGTGGGVAYNIQEFEDIVRRGLELSPVTEVLLEESILGWKEYEMEVMRDRADNVVIICSIENFDPMGVHTGDSITVAPAQTLTDKEYQRMRDATLACIRAIGVETGGSNVQFAIDPRSGRMTIIEMNPRVSRSSALASKATGFPIAKIAAKLAVGYTLDEIPNDITRETLACFEPTIDYVVTKIPRWTFEKFPEADPTLTVQMKSVGETMAIGRTFRESLQKALRGLEIGQFGLGGGKKDLWGTGRQPDKDAIRKNLSTPNADRIFWLRYAFKSGMSVEDIFTLTEIDPWYLRNIEQLVAVEEEIRAVGRLQDASPELLLRAKQNGFSDAQLGFWWDTSQMEVRRHRKAAGIEATFKQVDTCAAEFEAYTPHRSGDRI